MPAGLYARRGHVVQTIEERRARARVYQAAYVLRPENRGRNSRQNRYKREVRRFARYGLTREMFDEFLDAQEGACAFCGEELPKDISRFSIDHDHVTGGYRGLVHDQCNQIIGMGEKHLAGYLAASGA